MKQLLAATLILIMLVIAYQRDTQQLRSDAYEAGISEMIMSVGDCSLEDASANRCTIPCSTDMDCMEKNGEREDF